MITAKYQDAVKKKDKEIDFLRATMKKLEVSIFTDNELTVDFMLLL